MGSTGAAPKRRVESGGQNRHHEVANPEAAPTREMAQPVPPPTNNAFSSYDINRMEQLLTRLEARSVALVPYGYWTQPQAQGKKAATWFAALLVCIWLSGLALAIGYFSFKHPSQALERGVAAAPRVISLPYDPQDQRTAESVDHLARAVIKSSDRLNEVETALKKSNEDLRRLEAKVSTEGVKSLAASPTAVLAEKKLNDVVVAVFRAKPVASAPAAEVSKPATAVSEPEGKTRYRVLPVKPTDSAMPHKAADGSIDYWLVARGVFKELARVQPIAIAADGVVIHDLEDGKNYTLTRQGVWRDAEW